MVNVERRVCYTAQGKLSKADYPSHIHRQDPLAPSYTAQLCVRHLEGFSVSLETNELVVFQLGSYSDFIQQVGHKPFGLPWNEFNLVGPLGFLKTIF